MDSFGSTLKELMEDKSIDAKSLALQLEISDPSIIYRWLKNELGLLMTTAVKIAVFFSCSLDYLFCRSKYYKNGGFKKCPPFDVQFRKVLKEQKLTQYRLKKDKVISGSLIHAWLNNKHEPHMQSIIKLANYLNVSIDYLVGREA